MNIFVKKEDHFATNEQQKKALKKFDPRTWCTKKPFGYRVIHHGYSLMSCPGQDIIKSGH